MKDFFTHFGFQKVTPEEKIRLVNQVFERVSIKYDLMNDLMSMGIHRCWKSYLVRKIRPTAGMQILDVAGGTGDISLRLLTPSQPSSPQVFICDINPAMMQIGQDRAINGGIIKGLQWICGDAAHLPMLSASMDVYVIAFGLRNVTDIPGALAEARRVLKPQGRFFCLEFSKVTSPLLAKIYKMYTLEYLPRLGKLVANDGPSYQYLAESIAQFPSQEELATLIRQAGFSQVSYENHTGGIVALHQASGSLNS